MATENSTPPSSFEVPDGVELKQVTGKITGQTLYTIAGFNMPLMDSPEAAIRVYKALKHAYETGYFTGGAKKEHPTKVAGKPTTTSNDKEPANGQQ